MRSIIVGLVLVFAGVAVQAQEGEKVFQNICSKCHRDGAPDAPAPSTLRSLPVTTILTALESGKMMAIGKSLSGDQRDAVGEIFGYGGRGGDSAVGALHWRGSGGKGRAGLDFVGHRRVEQPVSIG